MLQKYEKDCICVDGTHGISGYGFELHTILVLDKLREGFPAPFCISNRSDEGVFFFETYSLAARKMNWKLQSNPKYSCQIMLPADFKYGSRKNRVIFDYDVIFLILANYIVNGTCNERGRKL